LRAVAATPNRSITGIAQWCPVRDRDALAVDDRAEVGAREMPSTTNDSTLALSRAVPISARAGDSRRAGARSRGSSSACSCAGERSEVDALEIVDCCASPTAAHRDVRRAGLDLYGSAFC
jgi:hypothetical protein